MIQHNNFSVKLIIYEYNSNNDFALSYSKLEHLFNFIYIDKSLIFYDENQCLFKYLINLVVYYSVYLVTLTKN